MAKNESTTNRDLRRGGTDLNWYILSPDSVKDTRNDGLVRRLMKRVSDFIGRNPGSSLPREINVSTETGASDALYTSFSDRLWQVYYDRRSIYIDLRDMDINDPIIHTALNILADCVTGYEDVDIDGFEWQMDNVNEKAMQVLKDLKSRLNLGSEVWQVVRKFVQYGEEFREIVVDDQMQIVRFKSLPSYQVMPNFDKYGNKQPGWQQRPEYNIPGNVILFEEWQLIPFIYGAKRGYFGTGLMMPGRRTWRRYQKCMDGLAIARMTRAYDKLLHRVPVRPEWDMRKQLESILEYKRNMTKRRGLENDSSPYIRDNPLTTETDFYIPEDGTKRGGIDVLSAQNMQLMNTEDLQLHLNEMLCCLRVPRKYLNMGSGTKGALVDGSLTAEDIQFARTLRQAQAVLRTGLIQLAYWALLFQGFMPEDIGVGVRLPKISTHDQLQDSKISFTMAQAAQLFSQTIVQDGLPWEILADRFMSLKDNEKLILSEFIKEKEADQERMERSVRAMGGSTKGVKTGASPAKKTMSGDSGGDEDDGGDGGGDGGDDGGQSAEAVARTLARLQVLCSAEMRKHGLIEGKEGIGFEERLQRNREIIADIAAQGE